MEILLFIVGAAFMAAALFVARNQSGDGSVTRWATGAVLGLSGLALWLWAIDSMGIIKIF